LVLIKVTLQTWRGLMARPRKLPLEVEAKEFLEKKTTTLQPPKPMTARRQMAAMMAAALLSRSSGPVQMEEIKKEAFMWADYMLSDD
jgi:hypothetical protein